MSSPVQHVVMGNEACDLDSAVSSLVYAFLLSETTGVFHAPLLNIPAEDLCLRTDITKLFEDTQVDLKAVLYVDTPALDLGSKLLHLVDHNRLAAAQESLESCVVEILDHHRDDGRCSSAKLREIVFPLGSCCSLVARHVLAHSGGSLLQDPHLARLLIAPILIDTGNLDPSLGKTEPLDSQMVAALAPRAGLEDEQRREAFFQEINAAKFDVSHLSARDLLRRDYKEFAAGVRRVGMSAVLKSLSDVNREEMDAAVDKWMTERNLDVLIVMTAYYQGSVKKFERQDWVVAREPTVGDALAKRLQAESSLDLVPLEKTVLRGHAFQQRDVKPSRKQLAPIVIDFLESSKL
jgi:exopolyphosphatase